MNRYTKVKALLNNETKELIPLWDERVKFELESEDDEYELVEYTVRIGKKIARNISEVECIYDTLTKTLSAGIEVIDKTSEKILFKKGEEILYKIYDKDKQHYSCDKVKVVDIVHELYDMYITSGKIIKDDEYYSRRLKIKDIDVNAIYAVKTFKPEYVLSNGVKTQYTHDMFYIAPEKPVEVKPITPEELGY